MLPKTVTHLTSGSPLYLCNQKRLQFKNATKKGCLYKRITSVKHSRYLMKIGAIITGDIVDSTKLSMAERNIMLSTIDKIHELLSPAIDIKMEIFRGDSFQIGISNAKDSIRAALAIRAHLRSHRFEAAKTILDARIAIGIGTLDYESETLSTSDGEAYRLSGRLLDTMDKARLKVCTPWHNANEELQLATAFADDIVSSWTQNQSKIILSSLLTSKSHFELSQELGISRQMVDKSLRASKEELIIAYIKRAEELITIYTKQYGCHTD